MLMQAETCKTKAHLKAAESKEEDAEQKADLLEQLEVLKGQKAALLEEQAALEVVDPDRFKAMKEASNIARDSANRWLDNTYALKQWCEKTFQGREKEVAKFFEENGLTDKVDYLD
jgi:hypothetical protein